ncbi:hypothetical protein [Actinomadura fulvescens]|uniref:Secreted protein n=1 Tax=Actinomadura fulvescens TaxID=46160 RepID=A0ABP6D9J3_9ACTN
MFLVLIVLVVTVCGRRLGRSGSREDGRGVTDTHVGASQDRNIADAERLGQLDQGRQPGRE